MKIVLFFIAAMILVSCKKQQSLKVATTLDSLKYGVYQVRVNYYIPWRSPMTVHIIDREGCFDTCFSAVGKGSYISGRFECCGSPRMVTEVFPGRVCN